MEHCPSLLRIVIFVGGKKLHLRLFFCRLCVFFVPRDYFCAGQSIDCASNMLTL